MCFYKIIVESRDLNQVPAVVFTFLPHTKEQVAVIGEGPVGFRGQGLRLVAGGPEGIHGGQTRSRIRQEAFVMSLSAA